MSHQNTSSVQRWMYLIALMFAGESIYLLPYLRKTFQTSMEALFELTSVEVGLLNSVFGILAILTYFPSGYLADRFSARRLLSFSLISTGLGGFVMLTSPSFEALLLLHAYWGVTSILTFWAALIKATRNWGTAKSQGKSFGLLDGGRGVVAAILASIATWAYASSVNLEDRMFWVVLIYSTAPILTGIVVWFVIPDHLHENTDDDSVPGSGIKQVKAVLKQPQLWLLSLIIFCAYTLYIGIFDFPAYAEKAYDQSKSFGALLGTIRDWMRPFAAIGAGILADKYRSSSMVGISFSLLFVLFLSLGFSTPSENQLWLLWVQILFSALAVFALRGVYFALMQEMSIPIAQTGIVVGIVSLIGYTPDIFLHLLSGWFVNNFEGYTGYQYYFLFLAFTALLGLIVALKINRSIRRQ